MVTATAIGIRGNLEVSIWEMFMFRTVWIYRNLFYFILFFGSSTAVGVEAVRSSLHYLRGLYQNEWRMDLDFTIRIRSDQIAYCAIGFILLVLGWLLDKIHSWFIVYQLLV
jgi:hypothetical protein